MKASKQAKTELQWSYRRKITECHTALAKDSKISHNSIQTIPVALTASKLKLVALDTIKIFLQWTLHISGKMKASKQAKTVTELQEKNNMTCSLFYYSFHTFQQQKIYKGFITIDSLTLWL